MTKSAVKVVVRTRPTSKFAQEYLEIRDGVKSINVTLPKKDSTSFVNNQRESYTFKFDNVLHNVTQETIFDECAREIISSVIDGYNGTIMAYGQTGAGKTFTMTGTTTNYKLRGLIPRVIEQVYYEAHNRPEKSFNISMSYLEIYNETLFDLLNASNIGNISEDNPPSDESIQIMEESNGSIFVRGLSKHVAADEEEGLSLMFEGEANRAICEHQLNTASTRSHCIFTIYVESRSRVESEGQTVLSKLNLVDLAGSERVGKTQSSGTVLKEAMYINKSLSFLEQVVIALSTPSRDHIPYRQSKLTHVLKDSLGGNCKTLMIANIWGEASQLEETVSTLKFATRMMRVSNNAIVNVQMNPEAQLKKYEKQIKELKQELAMHDQLKGVSQGNYDPYTEDQRFELRQQVRRYVDGDDESLEVKSIRHILEIFNVFRSMVKEAESQKHIYERTIGNRSRQNHTREPLQKKHSETKLDLNNSHSNSDYGGDGVGEVEYENGFGTGVAMPSSKYKRPSSKGGSHVSELKTHQHQLDMSVVQSTSNLGTPSPNHAHTIHNSGILQEERLDRNEAYEKFKIEDGKENFELLRDNTALLKEKKRLLKEINNKLNQYKKKIDECKLKIEQKKQENTGNDNDIVDQEELLIFNELKEAKTIYKDLHEERKMAKGEIDYMTKGVETARIQLLNQFEEWYQRLYGSLPEATNMSPRANSSSVLMSARSFKSANGISPSRHGFTAEDRLDDGERFEMLEEERIRREDPESYAFYRAKKRSQQYANNGRTVKMPPINKRR